MPANPSADRTRHFVVRIARLFPFPVLFLLPPSCGGEIATDQSGGDDASVDASVGPGSSEDGAVGDSGAGSDGSGCGRGQVSCSGYCQTNDINHCGPSCTSCTAPPGATPTCDGTKCGTTCLVLSCGGVCVDPTVDPANCGGCGKKCPIPGQACLNGTCGCPNGEPLCQNACTDTQTDNNN